MGFCFKTVALSLKFIEKIQKRVLHVLIQHNKSIAI